MDRTSTNDNFDHFLRQNADEFRMHPSPKVWEGISENLTKRKRKFYFGLAALLISSSILGYTLLDLSFIKIAKTIELVSAPSLNPNAAPTNKTIGTAKVTTSISPVAIDQHGKISVKTKRVTEQLMPEITANNFARRFTLQGYKIPGILSSPPSDNFLSGLSPHKKLVEFTGISSIHTADEKTADETNTSLAVKSRAKSGKFGVMFYFTPTVSYRKLSENRSYLRAPTLIGVPYNYAALYDINNAVTHKPNIGLELGVTTKYSLTKNIKLRGGLQFNINRYDIKAFKFIPEVATIALNNGSSGMQAVNTVSSYRNFNGGQTDWLQNFYFQVSTPIGAEVKLHGTDKMYIGAATTIQPTYVLGDRAYLITADYKNYAQVPWLIRRWNVNTNLETFVAYSTGNLKWQVGPQVRYQLLSSFVNKYPVKENLFDFGLKVGISVNQNQ